MASLLPINGLAHVQRTDREGLFCTWMRAGGATLGDPGPYSAEDWLRIYAAHAHNHAAQIRRLREALAAVAK